MLKRDASIFIHLHVLSGFLPLGAVSMAGMTLVVGLGVLEDETVGPLQPVRALLHAVGSIFEVEAFYTLVRALRGEEEQGGRRWEEEQEAADKGRIKKEEQEKRLVWWNCESKWRAERWGGKNKAREELEEERVDIRNWTDHIWTRRIMSICSLPTTTNVAGGAHMNSRSVMYNVQREELARVYSSCGPACSNWQNARGTRSCQSVAHRMWWRSRQVVTELGRNRIMNK